MVRLNYRPYYTENTGIPEVLCIKGISAKVCARAPGTGRYVFLSLLSRFGPWGWPVGSRGSNLLLELTLSSVAELAKVSELTLASPIQQELVAGQDCSNPCIYIQSLLP